MNPKLIVSSVLLLSIVTFTTQDITGRKGCDCSICKGVDNNLNPVVGNKLNDGGGGKSSCSICERRKEMLRMERERQQKLQKCPYEILGKSTIKGKNSEEIFDEFREMIVPSQNGFFDMMRGVVKTMHVSSETELKWAKEKEAKELAKKREEELKRMKESKSKKEDELVSLQNPINPKVTVVLKQTPCGQIIAPAAADDPEKVPLRLPKEVKGDALGITENEISKLQDIGITAQDQADADYMNLNSKENFLTPDLIDQLIKFNMWNTPSAPSPALPQTLSESPEPEEDILTPSGGNFLEGSTESPYVKFISNEELKAEWKSSRNSPDDIDLGLSLLPMSDGNELQQVNVENIQNVGYPKV